MHTLRARLKEKISLDSLIVGGNAFHSLLPKKVKDRCTHSKLNGRSSNHLLSLRKL